MPLLSMMSLLVSPCGHLSPGAFRNTHWPPVLLYMLWINKDLEGFIYCSRETVTFETQGGKEIGVPRCETWVRHISNSQLPPVRKRQMKRKLNNQNKEHGHKVQLINVRGGSALAGLWDRAMLYWETNCMVFHQHFLWFSQVALNIRIISGGRVPRFFEY